MTIADGTTPDAEHDIPPYGDLLTRADLLRRAIAAGVVVTGLDGVTGLSSALANSAPGKRGGTLQVGISGGSTKDSLNPWYFINKIDEARQVQLFESLAERGPTYEVQMKLAEEITAEKPDQWLIRLKPGIEFHNGQPLTADDVIYSLRGIINPKIPSQGGSGLASLDPHGMIKVDKLTVRLKLKSADGTILDELARYENAIVPNGSSPKHPIGTGPFKAQTFVPGQQSTFVRNPHYWQNGLPYIDQLVMIDLNDDSARVNALLGGQVQAIEGVPLAQVPVVKGRSDLRLLEAPSGGWLAFTMRVDSAPFNNNDVRQAMRWLVDRPQMITQALAGHGTLGNDLFSKLDPAYDHNIAQRGQDIAKAKFLLKRAGHSNLNVNLVTSDVAAGILGASQVLAQQALAAGVKITLQQVDSGTIFGTNYLKWPFAVDYWNPQLYLGQVAQSMLPTAPFNETHWPDAQSKARYISLYGQAKATANAALRKELIAQMQEIEWARGGYVIWTYNNFVDAVSTKVTGLNGLSKPQLPLSNFGFKHAQLT